MKIYRLYEGYRSVKLLSETEETPELTVENCIRELDRYYRIRHLDRESSFFVTTKGMQIQDLFLICEGDEYRIHMKADEILKYFWGHRDFEGILNFHNHPSGWCRESKRDVSFNEQLREAVHRQLNKKYLGGYIVTTEDHIRIHDHLYQYSQVYLQDYLTWCGSDISH
ncbi:MAG: hypothetical protein IIT72_04160 [Lachnospiraceae bacterium]|nr:hypothetical protein [Lachnospiraceae bacterium]